MKPIQYAIIGGTGVYDCSVSSFQETVITEYGETEVDITEIEGNSIVFLSRHGKEHGTPPHRINYRANLKALQELGVKQIFSTAAVGSLNPDYQTGTLVMMTDFLDMTRQRQQTFFDGDSGGVRHVKMDDPYCRNLRKQLIETAKLRDVQFKGGAVYICTEGPRLETGAEIKMMKQWGADVVGMTNVPEVVLAKELGLCYASVGFVVNMATGIEKGSIQLDKIDKTVARNKEKVSRLFMDVFSNPLDQRSCKCSDSILNL